jgi:Nucleolar GTP-binding protein 1 (NOG1)
VRGAAATGSNGLTRGVACRARQSITALAHLRAAVLYIVDISEQCGYTIAQQAALFHSIKPLFASKPLLVVANKVDVVSLDELSAEDKETLRDMALEAARASAGGVCVRARACCISGLPIAALPGTCGTPSNLGRPRP